MAWEKWHCPPGWAWYRIEYKRRSKQGVKTLRLDVKEQTVERAIARARKRVEHYGAWGFRCITVDPNKPNDSVPAA